MKQNLQLRLSQNLALTPQLQQSIRLLQLSSLELNQELELILQENPLLELVEGEDAEEVPDTKESSIDSVGSDEEPNTDTEAFSTHDFDDESNFQPSADVPEETQLSSEEFSTDEFNEDYEEYDSSSWEGVRQATDDDDSEFTSQETGTISLREHLLGQLKLMQLSERDQNLMLLLIDSLNEDGYLEASLEEIVESLPPELEVDLLELETALKHLQHLDPAGVGARNLQECLLLQLNALPPETEFLNAAKVIVESHLAQLANKDFVKLRKLLNCDEATLKGAQNLIRQQNPRPGSDFAQLGSDHFIQHEVVVRKIKGIWIASLNDQVIPKLRINQLYADILKRNRESSSQYLQSQMQEAKWMIKNIQQRFSTILRVSQAIVDRQRNFFEHGEIAMRPLVLREIADELELHESTISRVTTHKYMLTPRGVYELKYFFGSHVATDTGGACSATAIRALIKQMVAEENSRKPLSDNQITDILAKQGIVVARRTIAKYRESLNIPPANLRKSL
ncbi:MAG TPA: RNA polymerase factor sigma-54 [Methylophilus sp.]|nr:RNA polymerase factor sigma-54 [Methylophilus sp.]HQQ32782.1 RNA polymerase factor sigma-54 [Methylophilus sp.]